MRSETVGAVWVTLELANLTDEEGALRRYLAAEQVRRATVRALVDTGAARLVLPTRVVEQLGLRKLGQVRVRYADNRPAGRDRVGFVALDLMGRRFEGDAIAEPDAEFALLGQIPLEVLDLHVDCFGQRLVPSPDSPDMPFSWMMRSAA